MPAPDLLYLDTARLGQMSELAQRLSISFIRLSAEEPFSLYFERFLRNGFESWPESYQRRFSGLKGWTGIESLKQGIRRVAGARDESQVVIASRSLWLVRSAARAAYKTCSRLLTTDLSWPSYQSVFEREAARTGRELHCIPIRHDILSDCMGESDLVEAVASSFQRLHCDGIFLPAVDNLGIRLPIEKIVSAIEDRAELRVVLVDAAQAIGHIPLADVTRSSDFVIAGCHKWVRAYHPLGIGIFGGRESSCVLRNELTADREDDSLFNFLECLLDERLSGHMETVNLTPLFSCQGAISEFNVHEVSERFQCQRENAQVVRRLASESGWGWPRIDDPMQSGIQLCRYLNETPPINLEQSFHAAGVRATVYGTGLVRLSLPSYKLSEIEFQQLRVAVGGSRANDVEANLEVPTVLG